MATQSLEVPCDANSWQQTEDEHTELPGVLMGLRNMFKPNLGASATEMTFGSTIMILGDLL